MRTRIIKTAVIIILLSFMAARKGNCYKIHPNAGETSAAFLKIPPGGRGVAMGEAQAGITSDVFGMWWNPASIARINRKELALSYNKWFQDMYKSFTAGVFPVYKGESFGFMVDGLMMKSNIERRSGEDEDDPYYPLTSSEGEFGAYDLMVAGSYARKLSGKLYGGVTLKGILQEIDENKAYAIGIDIGIQHTGIKIMGKNIFFGAAIRNFGTAIKFKDEAYNLPLDYNLGMGTYLVDGLIMSLDFRQAVDNYLKIHTGLEYGLWGRLFVRAGYIYRLTGYPLGNMNGFRGGFGMRIGNFTFDYAYTPYSYLGESHRISIQAFFGKATRKRPRKRFPERADDRPAEGRDAALKNKGITVETRALSVTPTSVLWEVNCIKSKGTVRKIIYITDQQTVDNIKFEIRESTAVPRGINAPAGRKIINSISIGHNLVKGCIKKAGMELVIKEGTEVLDADFNKLNVKETDKKNNMYFIDIGAGEQKFFIVGNAPR